MICIPKNDYVPDTSIRENVVQDICNAFLQFNAWSTFYPYNTSAYRRRTNGLVYHKNGQVYGFHHSAFTGETIVKFSSAELNMAIKCLVKAGWHMFYLDNGGWPAIKCSKYPTMERAREIMEWTEFFDK